MPEVSVTPISQPEALRQLLEAVATGAITPAIALDKLKHFDLEPVGDFAKIDNHRPLRTGLPEVIWGPGKTPDHIAQIMATMGKHHPVVMATRISPSVAAQVQHHLPRVTYHAMAQICSLGQPEPAQGGTITLLAAGTADLPIAEEAATTAELSGFPVERLWDVGVAGLHRLLAHRQTIMEAQVIIVVAGMEGALPTVVAGLTPAPVIAVPTSVGYGAHFQGLAPLLTMLNACAPGIGVVNIDNGFGAAMLAAKILRSQCPQS